jgi:large subunit ribosomal protein L24
MNRIRSGDTVVITTGKSKGHVGKVIKVLDKTILVEGGNLNKKHVKPNPQLNQQGGIITREAPIDVSNVAMYNPVSKKADKIGFKFIEKDGKKYKVRYFKSNDEVIDRV